MKGAKKVIGKVRQDKPLKDLNRTEQPEDAMRREEGQHVRTGLEAISKQISELKSELKRDLKMT